MIDHKTAGTAYLVDKESNCKIISQDQNGCDTGLYRASRTRNYIANRFQVEE